MRTRKNFLDWINILNNQMNFEINHSKFYNIHEREYLYKMLYHILQDNMDEKHFIYDYINLEDQRYKIIDDNIVDESISISEIEAAIQFCSKSDANKRSCTFIVNPNLSNYLAKSSFLWDNITNKNPEAISSYYLFIPTFLSISPKEICLSNINALLLDIKDYAEEFSYGEFFELVASTLNLQENDLDKFLLEFISNQVLYYRTILPVKKKAQRHSQTLNF